MSTSPATQKQEFDARRRSQPAKMTNPPGLKSTLCDANSHFQIRTERNIGSASIENLWSRERLVGDADPALVRTKSAHSRIPSRRKGRTLSLENNLGWVVAVLAVLIEPVSPLHSLINRENTGNFSSSGRIPTT